MVRFFEPDTDEPAATSRFSLRLPNTKKDSVDHERSPQRNSTIRLPTNNLPQKSYHESWLPNYRMIWVQNMSKQLMRARWEQLQKFKRSVTYNHPRLKV